MTTPAPRVAAPPPDQAPRRSAPTSRSWWRRARNSQGVNGWLMTAPVLIGLTVFLIVPILMAFWVSFRHWNGLSPPLDSESAGLTNYKDLLIEPGLTRTNFARSLRNNLYYVLGVVPVQTFIAFLLAVVVNQKFLKGKSFFRAAYYFPSITSSIAIALIFLFLFQPQGGVNWLVNPIAKLFGHDEPIRWLDNSNGLIHNALGLVGVDQAPGWLADNSFMGLPLWEWAAGPSVVLYAIMLLATWTTTGTLMLIFLAGLQNISSEVEEASQIDGCTPARQFRYITVPLMKPALLFCLTIGVIGTWQVFDQIFAISPDDRTVQTPAYLVYREGFKNSSMGRATAIAFILFVIIMVFTLVQRRLVKDED